MEVKRLCVLMLSLQCYGDAVSPKPYCEVISMDSFKSNYILDMKGSQKGDMGRILVVGGSTEYSGAPYFSAISALKAGADLVFVLTTPSSASIIKAYSPELIVYPYLHQTNYGDIFQKIDVVVIGPGLGKSDRAVESVRAIIKKCKELKKPLIVDTDGLYAISKNKTEFRNYPRAILTPNHLEAVYLMNDKDGYGYFGREVSVLEKGKEDTLYINGRPLWRMAEGGSARRVAGQGDILSGILATFYNWAIRSKCKPNNNLAQSIAAFAASRLTRKCNEKAFLSTGRSMTASDMIYEIHNAYKEFFE